MFVGHAQKGGGDVICKGDANVIGATATRIVTRRAKPGLPRYGGYMGDGLLSAGHLLIVALIALVVFGPKRLPEMGRSVGAGMRGFKRSLAGDDDDEQTPAAKVEKIPPPAPPTDAR